MAVKLTIDLCLICALDPILLPLFWVLSVDSFCKHKPGSHTTKVGYVLVPSRRIYLIYFFYLIVVLMIFWNIYTNYIVCETASNIDCLCAISDILVQISGSCVIYVLLKYRKRLIYAINSWSAIVDEVACEVAPESYNFCTRSYIRSFSILFLMILFVIVHVVGTRYYIKIDYDLSVLSHIISIILMQSQMIVLMTSVQLIITVQDLMRFIYEQFKFKLTHRFNYDALSCSMNFYRYLKLNYDYWMDMGEIINGATLLCMIVNVAALINNFYLLMLSFGNSSMRIVYVEYKTACTIFAFLAFIWAVDDMAWNDEVLSFLFRYPISKLTSSEASQIETLASKVILLKPILRASDIITIGTRLIASITGTIVTYVLVALQFRVQWGNKEQ